MPRRGGLRATASIRRPRRGLAALRGVQGFRRSVQVVVAALVAWVAVTRALAAATGPNVTSPEAICPFGGIETLVTFLTTGAFVPHVHAANVVLALAVLVLAILARGAFCGWICPLGFLQDLVAGAGAFVQRHVPAAHRGVRALRRHAAPLMALDRPLRLVKYAVLAWAIWGTAAFGVMVFRDVDPWIALLDIGRESTGFGLAILGVMLIGSLVRRPAVVPLRLPAGRRQRDRRPLQPGPPRAVRGGLRRLQPVHKELPHGTSRRHGDRHHLAPTASAVSNASRRAPAAGALELRVGLPIGGQA